MADELSTRIRLAREGASLTQEQIAAALGVVVSTYVRLETGRTKRVSAETLRRIGELTGKPLSYFFEEVTA